MFGMTPGIYKNEFAARMACIAYEKEESVEWVAVFKYIASGSNSLEPIYKPCRAFDLEEAEKENWTLLQ